MSYGSAVSIAVEAESCVVLAILSVALPIFSRFCVLVAMRPLPYRTSFLSLSTCVYHRYMYFAHMRLNIGPERGGVLMRCSGLPNF